MFRSFRPGFITVSTENYRGMVHMMEKNSETDKSCTMTSILRICFFYSQEFLFLSFVVLLLCTSGSFPHFFTGLLPTGLSRMPHVIELLWFPYIYSRYLYMYLFGLIDKLPAKELR